MAHVRDVRTEEIDEATAVLRRAFDTDPSLVHLLPDADDRARIGPKLARTWLRYCIGWGRAWGVEHGGKLVGVALRRPPGQEGISLWGLFASGMWIAPFLLGVRGTYRLLRAALVTDVRHAKVMRERHWYCWLLAVDPEVQGAGYGGLLMNHTFDQADADGVPCYLETASERALSVHQAHGYEVIDDSCIGEDLRVWTMVRPPRRRLREVA